MKTKILVLLLFIFSFQNVMASLGEDLKTLGLSSLYGTLGGTLVGVAAMAISKNSQDVAKGASIGLVAGAGFGGYFVYRDNMARKALEGENGPMGEPSRIYDSTKVNDYNDIYYGKRWEMEGNWDQSPTYTRFEHQLNKIPAKNNLTIFFNLFQKNF
ncbi:MAG: hypothetical protein ACHQYQ_01390 [Bacteriovoracales bacterium]